MEPLRCHNKNDKCQGAVEMHTVGQRLKAFPRCDFHLEERLDSYENSSERWAFSSIPPEDFDPSYAGEDW